MTVTAIVIGVKIRWISVGPHRDQAIDVQATPQGGKRRWNKQLQID